MATGMKCSARFAHFVKLVDFSFISSCAPQDIDLNFSRIVSCGMDHSLKVWALDTPAIIAAITASDAHNPDTAELVFLCLFSFFLHMASQSKLLFLSAQKSICARAC